MGRTLSRILHWSDSDNVLKFENLPEVCQLKIFGFLSVAEKGVAAQVCKKWNGLLKSPVLWTNLDLTVFRLHSQKELLSKKHVCNLNCYNMYKAKMNSFLAFVIDVAPSVRLLKFAFDIGDVDDGWLDWIRLLLTRVRCCNLTEAAVCWKDTGVCPKVENLCSEENVESVRLIRHRQRLFVGFLEHFVSVAPNLSHLEVEFDWSVWSVDALAKLRRLETLTLRRYFAFQALDQELMNRLLDSLPCLRRLAVEVWTPNSTGLCRFVLKSNVLQHLDISSCRGFYLADMDLPWLRSIRMSLHPWSGPLVTVGCGPLPCVYHGFVRGAPSLREINGLSLQSDWKTHVCPELNSVLEAVCPCHLHSIIPNSCVK